MTDYIATYPFIDYLQQLEKKDLPGFEAQSNLMPKMDPQNHFPEPCPNCDHAAVLCLLIPEAGSFDIVLTVRSKGLSSHKGQISFPGGRLDEGESYSEAALRETFEEIGVASDKITLLGELSGLRMAHRNMYVQPLIGVTEVDKFEINPAEVAEVFTVSMEDLLHEGNISLKEKTINGVEMKIPQWDIHPDVPLWGATAMMISELVELYRRFLEKRSK